MNGATKQRRCRETRRAVLTAWRWLLFACPPPVCRRSARIIRRPRASALSAPRQQSRAANIAAAKRRTSGSAAIPEPARYRGQPRDTRSPASGTESLRAADRRAWCLSEFGLQHAGYGRPAYPGTAQQTYAPPGHLGAWLNTHRNVPVPQQQQMLRNDPSFRRLPQGEQQRLMNQLNRVNQMPDAQRQRRWRVLKP